MEAPPRLEISGDGEKQLERKFKQLFTCDLETENCQQKMDQSGLFGAQRKHEHEPT